MLQEKSRDERIAELLEKSGSEAVAAIKGPSLSDLAPMEPKIEEKTEEPIEEEETESGGKKVRIPVSRLKTLTSKVSELEAKLQERDQYTERIAALEEQIQASKEDEEDLPEWWKEAYGDTDVSKQGYRNQQRIMREEFQRNIQQAEADRHAADIEREQHVKSVEASFDAQMESLEESLGRELTSTQKSELMDIVGEYSPMEGDQYVAYLPIEKAYDIWTKGQGQNQGKQEIARIASIQSSGNSSASSQSSERPQWGDWRKRFNL